MIFNIREYKCQFSGQKGEEELAIASRMMQLINNKKFDSIEDIEKYNGSLNDFLKNQHFTNVVKHYGSALKESDYTSLIQNFKELTKEKLDFEKKDINTTKIEQSEYVEYNGVVLDNSENSKSIEEQMKDIQLEQEKFHTTDKEKNTENMMDEMQNQKKQVVEFTSLNEINTAALNEEEMKVYNAALVKQFLKNNQLKVNISEGLIMDENNNISKVFQEDYKTVIKENENSSVDLETTETNIKYLNQYDRSSLSPYEETIFEAAVNYQLKTNEVIRLDITNMLIINENNETKQIIEKDGILVVNDERMFENQSMEYENKMEKQKVKALELTRPTYQETNKAA